MNKLLVAVLGAVILTASAAPSYANGNGWWKFGAGAGAGYVLHDIIGGDRDGPRYYAPAPQYYYVQPAPVYVQPAPIYVSPPPPPPVIYAPTYVQGQDYYIYPDGRTVPGWVVRQQAQMCATYHNCQ